MLFAAVVERYERQFASAENPLIRVLDQTLFPDDIAALAGRVRNLVRDHRSYWLLWYVDVLEFGRRSFGAVDVMFVEAFPIALLGNRLFEGLTIRFDQKNRRVLFEESEETGDGATEPDHVPGRKR